MFIQRGWLNSNQIVLDDSHGSVVIDTGHPAQAEATLQLLQAHGVNLMGIRLLVATHCHWDHFGATHALQAINQAPLATSDKTAVIFEQHDTHAMWLDYFGVALEPHHADIIWHDGDEVELAGWRFEIIGTPGHAPDSIALFQPDTRLLVSADALHENDCGILNTAVHGEDVLTDAIATVERLRTYDAAVALPGHGPIITDVAANLDALTTRLTRFQAEPAQMASHLLRRVLMSLILLVQPISRAELLALCLERPWLYDYAPRCGYDDPEKCFYDLLATFMARGLVIEAEAQLRSLVPR